MASKLHFFKKDPSSSDTASRPISFASIDGETIEPEVTMRRNKVFPDVPKITIQTTSNMGTHLPALHHVHQFAHLLHRDRIVAKRFFSLGELTKEPVDRPDPISEHEPAYAAWNRYIPVHGHEHLCFLLSHTCAHQSRTCLLRELWHRSPNTIDALLANGIKRKTRKRVTNGR